MWIRLTKRGHHAVLRVIGSDDGMLEAFTNYVIPNGNRVDVQAPYAAWHFAQRQLYHTVFGPRGGRRARLSTTYHNAIKTITQEINMVDKHPALRNIAMLGWQTDVIPAWELDNFEERMHTDADARKYTPYPQPNKRFVLLSPVWEKIQGGTQVTRWVTNIPGYGSLADEETHLVLWRYPVS